MEALEELESNLTSQDNSKPMEPEEKIPTNPSNQSEDDGEGDIENAPLSEKIYATKSKRSGDGDSTKTGTLDNSEVAQNVQIVMKCLEGNIQRSLAKKGTHPGGLPRRYKRMNSFYEIEDVDPMDATIWTKNLSPQLPRVHQREREMMGGEIAILRDISTSMMGVYSEWSSSVVKAVLELARTKRMRVGYIEFNHKSFKTIVEEKFFTKEYDTILQSANKTECSGNTNYEEALKDAISDFKGRGLRNKHILFITDGIPTSGDTDVRKERVRAKKLGICIHSIFIGSKNFPQILNTISKETWGSQFVAYENQYGKIVIERKESSIKFHVPKGVVKEGGTNYNKNLDPLNFI